jgi:hypothetical protein
MRTVHSETVIPGRRPPRKKAKTDAGDAERHDDDDADFETGQHDEAGGMAVDEAPEWDSPELLHLAALYPEYDIDFLRYLTTIAKYSHQVTERDALLMEYEMVAKKEAQLLEAKEKLLDEIWLQELGCVRLICLPVFPDGLCSPDATKLSAPIESQ